MSKKLRMIKSARREIRNQKDKLRSVIRVEVIQQMYRLPLQTRLKAAINLICKKEVFKK
jgi:hypothetical protein